MKEKDMEEAVVKAYMDLMVDGDEIFNSVLENFPDIEKGEIAIEYNVFDSFTAGISMIDEDEYDSTGKIVRKPTIYFGESFPNYPREKQEIIIAHEFGHYRKMKGMDDSELKFDLEMLTSSNIISHQIMPEIFRIEPSWKAEVKKWSLEN
ncbi:MAG: hypothetical protein L6408_02710, partial [Nanoarchaeota archaeon]|nr:hypothetical protein [Nanoarchaeota archaeon]